MVEGRLKSLHVTRNMFTWNLAGSVVNASLSFFMMSFVAWNVGIEEAGYFSLALAVSQQLLTFGRYGIRTYQATDVKNRIHTGSYLCHRWITVLGMMVIASLIVCISGYGMYKRNVIWHVCALKAVDAVEDVFHGQLQRDGRLDLAGKLLLLRNVLTLTVFGIAIFVSGNLLLTCQLTWVISFAFCLIGNLPILRKRADRDMHAEFAETWRLFYLCFPLFASQFLSLLIYNMPKYAVDVAGTSKMQAIYGMIFMPAFVINMISEFVFRPLLTPLSIRWEGGDKKQASKMISVLFMIVAGISLVILVAGFLVAIPLMEWFYHTRLQAYKKEFMILLLGGGFSAAVYLSYHLLVIMRKMKDIFWGYCLGTAVMAAVVWKMVQAYGIFGAASSYLFAEVLIFIYFARCVKKYVRIDQ